MSAVSSLADGRAPTVRAARPDDGPALIELMRSNPITMESTYVVDRSPDFFALQRAFPGSATLVAHAASESTPAACASLLRYAGRLGGAIRPYLLLTDVCRRPGTGGRAFREVMLAVARAYHAADVDAFVCLVNQHNGVARRLAESPRLRLPLRTVGDLDYVEVLPRALHRIPRHVSVRRSESADDVERAFAFLNEHHRGHLLWQPWTSGELERRGEHLPGLDRSNVVLQETRGRLVGALVDYDPSPLVNLRVLRYDWRSSLAARALRGLRRLGAPGTLPPAEGERILTRQVQAVAVAPDAGPHLLGWLGNEVLHARAHTYAFLVDPRVGPRPPHRLCFRYSTRVYVSLKATVGSDAADLAGAPVAFNVTQD